MNDTTTPPPPPGATPPGATPPGDSARGKSTWGSRDGGPDRERLRSVTETQRATEGRLVAGVAAGLGRQLGIDPIIVRIVFVALTFAGLAGAILYATAWFVMPSDDGRRSVMADWFRLGSNEPQARTAALVIGGALALASVVGDTGWFWGATWPFFTLWLVVPALFFYWLFAVLPRQRAQGGPGGARPTPPTTPAPTGPAPAGPAQEADVVRDESSPAESTLVLDRGPASPPPPPAPVAAPMPFVPRTPPVLFWATMSVVVLALGVLALIDLSASHDIVPEVYAATALGVTGLGLLVGARWGRSVALVPVGFVLAFALVVTAVFPSGPAGDFHHSPTSASAVDPVYDLGAGQLDLDLTTVSDPEALLGRTVTVDGGVGQVRVIVPQGLNVEVRAYVTGGDITIFGQNTSGFRTELAHPSGPGPRLMLDITHTFGQISVVEAS